jgi:hypothetical protein
LFGEAISRVSDGRVHVYKQIKKKETQTTEARQERNLAIARRDKAVSASDELRRERDKIRKKNSELLKMLNEKTAENRRLNELLQNKQDWTAEVIDVKKY